MSRVFKSIQYLVIWGGLGFALFAIAKPSPQELQKIKDFSARNPGFSDVLRAAADPNSKPLHTRKPGEQFVVKTEGSK